MESKQNINSNKPAHPGGNPKFWQDEMVQRYDNQQSLLSEKKEETLANIIRIIAYFCRINNINAPKILDIGCGPGTPGTLSAHILKDLPNSSLVGVDSSNQMVDAANQNLKCEQFIACVGDFNSNSFWIELLSRTYDFIVSSGSLHYLADRRRIPFLKGIYDHLESHGIFLAGIAIGSEIPAIFEMEQVFRTEYTYNRLPDDKKPEKFSDFRSYFTDVDRKANVNWKSHSIWLDSLKSAGFKSADVVSHLWVRSILLGIK
jgi:trans-aconitate methyltransferase